MGQKGLAKHDHHHGPDGKTEPHETPGDTQGPRFPLIREVRIVPTKEGYDISLFFHETKGLEFDYRELRDTTCKILAEARERLHNAKAPEAKGGSAGFWTRGRREDLVV